MDAARARRELLELMTVEERATKNRVTYVDRVEWESDNRRLTLFLVTDPEQGIVDRVLTFTGVEEFELSEDREDPDLLELLLGIDEYRRGKGRQFVVALEQSEMIFYTEAEPEVTEVPATVDY